MPAQKTETEPGDVTEPVGAAAAPAPEPNGPEPTPDQVGYCHQPDCPQYGVEVALWKNLEAAPVMCGCGHLLSPHRVED